MRVALATCSLFPELDGDDRFLLEALRQRGVQAEPRLWNDPSVDWQGYDLCLIRSTWDYVEHIGDYLAWVRRVPRLVNSPEVVEWNHDKIYLRQLEAAGIPVVPTEWPEGEVDLEEIRRRRGWDEVVVKPRVSAGSRHTVRTRSGLDLPPGHRWMVQPYVDSVAAEGELSLVFFGQQLAHAVCKRPTPGDFRVQAELGGRFSRFEPSLSLLQSSLRCLQQLPAPCLYARVDWLVAPGGSYWLGELEAIEPSLYFEQAPESASVLADLVVDKLG